MRNTRMLVLLFLFLLILPACALADGGQISGFVWLVFIGFTVNFAVWVNEVIFF